jgi:hypothetical protein
MAEKVTKTEKVDTPFKDAIFKPNGGIGSPTPQSLNKGSK